MGDVVSSEEKQNTAQIAMKRVNYTAFCFNVFFFHTNEW